MLEQPDSPPSSELDVSRDAGWAARKMIPSCAYRIDSMDCIAGFDSGFASFADRTAFEVAPELVGQSIWPYIKGEQVRDIYVALVGKVRAGARVEFPFRCDSPTVRRDMQMFLTPAAGGAVEFTTAYRRITSRDSRMPAMLVADDGLLRLCAWCLRVDSGGWHELEVAVDRFGLFDNADVTSVTHCICGDCRDAVVVDL